MTSEEAQRELSSMLSNKMDQNSLSGKVIPPLIDKAIKMGDQNKSKIQAMLDKLLQKKGVLSPEEEASVVSLLKKQREEQDRQRAARTRTAVAIIGIGLLAFGGLWWIASKN